ncbi:MAG: hypothetical protein WBP61_16255 [Nocardioides sp.]
MSSTSSAPLRHPWRLVALPLVALLLSACGSDPAETAAEPDAGSSEAQSTQTPSPTEGSTASVPADAAACAAVWREGEQLARGYAGCVDESGEFVEREALGCSSGQRLVRHADTYYAVIGGTIHESATTLDEDRDYRLAVRSCRA